MQTGHFLAGHYVSDLSIEVPGTYMYTTGILVTVLVKISQNTTYKILYPDFQSNY